VQFLANRVADAVWNDLGTVRRHYPQRVDLADAIDAIRPAIVQLRGPLDAPLGTGFLLGRPSFHRVVP
jgi:hypothetical protein